jgi:hypothetical protein
MHQCSGLKGQSKCKAMNSNLSQKRERENYHSAVTLTHPSSRLTISTTEDIETDKVQQCPLIFCPTSQISASH